MNDFEITVSNGKELVETLIEFVQKEKCNIRLMNVKVKTVTEPESAWYCDVELQEGAEGSLLIKGLDDEETFPSEQLVYVKVRPFYYAACIGNKNLVFHIEH